MKIIKITLAAISAIIMALYLCLSLSSSARQRHQAGCEDIRVTIVDSMQKRFVTEQEVLHWVTRECGECKGKRLTEIDLPLIEHIVESESAVNSCEAYILRNGQLNIKLSQHTPVVKFSKGGTHIYANEQGYLFPIQKNAPVEILTVDGNIPIDNLSKGPASQEEKEWIARIMEMFSHISSTDGLKDNVARLHVEKNGEITIYPQHGKEKILFSYPVNMDRKFGRIRHFYTDIVNEAGRNKYSTVNVKYDGQVICRK